MNPGGLQDSCWQAAEVPDRLAINSPVLRQDLLLATGIEMGEKSVLLRPFKLLILYEQEIRHHLENREKIYRNLIAKANTKLVSRIKSKS